MQLNTDKEPKDSEYDFAQKRCDLLKNKYEYNKYEERAESF